MLEVIEHTSSSYAPRTYANASVGDVTVAFAVDFHTAGEKLTKKAAGTKLVSVKVQTGSVEERRKAIKDILDVWIQVEGKTMNIAGNGIYTLSKKEISQAWINKYVYTVLRIVHGNRPITRIVSGGQTGADIAGAVAAVALGIPAFITLPKGFKQRFEDGIDVEQDKDTVIKQILDGVNMLKQL